MRSLSQNSPTATLAIIAVLAGANGVQGQTYAFGAFGSTDCPDGYDEITDATTCEAAAASGIGAAYSVANPVDVDSFPKGCIQLHETSNNNAGIHFNVPSINTAGMASEDVRPICVQAAGAEGDPMTKDEKGKPVRFYISSTSATSLIQQPPGIDVVVVGGPATSQGAVKRGDWMTEVSLLVGGEPLLKATVRSGLAAGAKSLQGRYPLGGELPASLTSLNLTTFPEGKVIQDVGSFGLQAKGSALPASVTVSQVSSKPIGKAYVETATIKIGGTFELMLFTAKANKFESEREQIAYTHLDFKMIKYDRETVTGPLPEMWGLQPMSGATKAMLSPPHAAA